MSTSMICRHCGKRLTPKSAIRVVNATTGAVTFLCRPAGEHSAVCARFSLGPRSVERIEAILPPPPEGWGERLVAEQYAKHGRAAAASPHSQPRPDRSAAGATTSSDRS